MKVTIERAALVRALGHVQRVVERRVTIPILSNVLIRTEGGAVTLKATDLDVEVTERVPAEVSEDGATTLPAHTLHEIARKLPDDAKVVLELSGDSGLMSLRGGRSRFQLQCLPPSDFPDLTVGEMSHRFKVPGGTLARMLGATGFAMSTEETRYYLNGVYLQATEEHGREVLRMVATDGHRLALADSPAPEGSRGMPGIIVPRKAALEISRLVEDPTAEVTVEASTTKLRLTVGEVVLTTKIVDGTFPDYNRVIPRANPRRVVASKAELTASAERVTAISAERGRAVKVSLEPGRVTLSVNNPDTGAATEEIDVDYEGEAMEIGFNSRYLVEIAGQLVGDRVVVRMADAGSPVLIEEEKPGDAFWVLMPLRV